MNQKFLKEKLPLLLFAAGGVPVPGTYTDPSIGCEFAPGTTNVPSLGCLANVIKNIIGLAFLFVGAVAIIILLYGSILFIISRGDPKGLEKARKTMTYALIGVVLVLSAFILLNVIATMFGTPNLLQNFSLFVH